MALPRLRLRQRLATAIERSGVAAPVLRARARTMAPWLTVLTWHRVREVADSGGFDDGVVDSTVAEFDAQLEVLARDFTFVGVDDLLRWRRGGALPKNPVLVTFDDGYRECGTHVLPLLQKHGARAVFFISTEHVEQRRLFWWDRACFILRRATVQRATLPAFGGLALELASDTQRRVTERRVLRKIKDTAGLDLEAFLLALAEACGVEWSSTLERALTDSLISTWEDVRALRRAGMDVQSHTRTHRVLQTLSPAEVARELGGSREELEGALGEPIRAIAYPTGRPLDDELRRAVARAGYELGFENAGGVNLRVSRRSPLALRRVPMSPGLSPRQFQGLLAVPFLT